MPLPFYYGASSLTFSSSCSYLLGCGLLDYFLAGFLAPPEGSIFVTIVSLAVGPLEFILCTGPLLLFLGIGT
jgi:hypothetical protein